MFGYRRVKFSSGVRITPKKLFQDNTYKIKHAFKWPFYNQINKSTADQK